MNAQYYRARLQFNAPDMTPPLVHEIWPVETGITDLDVNPAQISVPALADIREVWAGARGKLENTDQLRTFNERLAREWAIETGVIEDVFHIDKGVTVNLIEQGISAALLEHGTVDKPVDYVISILRDHVETLDWLFDRFIVQQRPVTVGAVKDLHALMTAHQANVDAQDAGGHPIRLDMIKGDWKRQPNNALRDGVMYCYCPPEFVQSEMERLFNFHAEHEASGFPSEVAAAWLHHRFTQIHPFQDGNGRVARALATLVFLRGGLFPLVINREMRAQYIDALERADSGDLKPLVQELALAQQSRFDQALNIAEDLTALPKSVELAVQSLKDRFATRTAEVAAEQRRVFELATILQNYSKERLHSVRQLLEPIHSRLESSDETNDFYYREQIIDEARRMGYYPNTTVYRAWVRLVISGGAPTGPDATPAILLFSFHGRGSEFAGVMVCAPIFEIVSEGSGEEAPRVRTLVPISDKPFEFYFTESADTLRGRFSAWLEEAITLAISQYQRMV